MGTQSKIMFAWNAEEGKKMRPLKGKINQHLVTETFLKNEDKLGVWKCLGYFVVRIVV